MVFRELAASADNFAWGPWLLILLVGTGIYTSVKTGFVQFRHFRHAMRNTIGRIFRTPKAGSGEITPFQAVTTALAATMGTGNIAGVTGAIAAGGPGAVFWMWISALFGMCTKYSEVVLAVRFRERDDKDNWVGGPMYYIKNGLGKDWAWLGKIFAFLGAIAAFGVGNLIQVNTIVSSAGNCVDAFGGNTGAAVLRLFGRDMPVFPLAIGGIVALFAALVLLGGVKRIGQATEKLVPFMAVVYIFAALAVIFAGIDRLPAVLRQIFVGAFSAKGALGGAFGITIMTTVKKGVGRGVFSNEAGLGSASIAHAATSETNPVRQGLYGIFEVFMDTIVVCSLTAFCVLLGGNYTSWGSAAGTELTTAAFASVWGVKAGSFIVALDIALFATSTILSWSLYGVRCCEYLFGSGSILPYRIIFILLILPGAVLSLDTVWNISGALNGFMAIPNLIAILGLTPVVAKLTRAYFSGTDCLVDSWSAKFK